VQVRLQAILALRRQAGVQAIPALADLLGRDPDASVRSAAITALGRFREASAVAALKAALGHGDQDTRQQAARALRRQGIVLP
jgi:HEAT repeat protein